MTYEEAVECYLNIASGSETLPQPSESLSERHDDGVWALANVNGLLSLVDVDGSVLVYEMN